MRLLIPRVQEALNRRAKHGDAAERAPPDGAALQQREPALDLVERTRAGRREVQMEPRVVGPSAPWCCACTTSARSRRSIWRRSCCRCVPAKRSDAPTTIGAMALPRSSRLSTWPPARSSERCTRRHRALEFRHFFDRIDREVPTDLDVENQLARLYGARIPPGQSRVSQVGDQGR